MVRTPGLGVGAVNIRPGATAGKPGLPAGGCGPARVTLRLPLRKSRQPLNPVPVALVQSLLAHPFVLPILIFLTLWVLFYLPLAGVGRLGLGVGRAALSWVGRTRLGEWAARRPGWHGIRRYAPEIVLVLVGVVASVVAAQLFVEVAERIGKSTSVVYRLDRTVHDWFVRERQSGVTALLKTITFFGGSTGIALVVGLATALLLAFKERANAA